MFYAHFVLSKKGPLARIWLAAHWDKKLTKAHVFETNIDSSVEAILKPKVKMALRTSGHLLLGVVRIYSRKAKYLLSDCNEAFVKIKMAFRPGIVDLPEESREAAVAAITLQENFHDFEATLADLEDIDVQAQFSVNQCRPEEITMREDLGSITMMGEDGFGDIGFDERELLHDAVHLEDPLYKNRDRQAGSLLRTGDKTLVNGDGLMSGGLGSIGTNDGFGIGDGFMDTGGNDVNDDDDDNDSMRNAGNDFFDEWGGQGGLFEDTPMLNILSTQDASRSCATESHIEAAEQAKDVTGTSVSEAGGEVSLQAVPASTISSSAISGAEQTTLVHNEEEAFALEPLDVTAMAGGTERKGKRKRKLIVDEQKGIPSETMKLQLSDTADIVTTLDLAPPTKRLMQWKETGGVEKLFALSGRLIVSKALAKPFSKNLLTKQMESVDCEDSHQHLLPELSMDQPLAQPEVLRDAERLGDITRQSEMSTILEEPFSVRDDALSLNSTRSRRSERSAEDKSFAIKSPRRSTHHRQPVAELEPVPTPRDTFAQIPDGFVDNLTDATSIEPTIDPNIDLDGPSSVAPFSVPPPSNAPASVLPSLFPEFENLEEAEGMPDNDEQDEKRLTKRTQQMHRALSRAFSYSDELSFSRMTQTLNRKQVASRFYTLLVLKKHRVVTVLQAEPFGDIEITEGPLFDHDL